MKIVLTKMPTQYLLNDINLITEKVPEKDDGLDGLLEFAPTNLKTPEKAEGVSSFIIFCDLIVIS